MSSPVGLNCVLDREFLRVGEAAEVNLAVDLVPASTALPSLQPPVNLCIAIDRSGSMAEQNKLENAKEAAIQTIRGLRPSDALSLISFAGDIAVEQPGGPAGDPATLEGYIRKLHPG